jgi:hypothetical protein
LFAIINDCFDCFVCRISYSRSWKRVGIVGFGRVVAKRIEMRKPQNRVTSQEEKLNLNFWENGEEY